MNDVSGEVNCTWEWSSHLFTCIYQTWYSWQYILCVIVMMLDYRNWYVLVIRWFRSDPLDYAVFGCCILLFQRLQENEQMLLIWLSISHVFPHGISLGRDLESFGNVWAGLHDLSSEEGSLREWVMHLFSSCDCDH